MSISRSKIHYPDADRVVFPDDVSLPALRQCELAYWARSRLILVEEAINRGQPVAGVIWRHRSGKRLPPVIHEGRLWRDAETLGNHLGCGGTMVRHGLKGIGHLSGKVRHATDNEITQTLLARFGDPMEGWQPLVEQYKAKHETVRRR